MKLHIRKIFFEQIKAGDKTVEFRDAHISFVCEETGRILRKDVESVMIVKRSSLSKNLKNSGCFDDKRVIAFRLI
jgi:hypothetical protein